MANIRSEVRSQCAELSPQSPMAGTAEVVDVWILLEERLSWPEQAVSADVLPTAVHQWLMDQVDALARAGLRARPQLIRQETRSDLGRRLLLGYGGTLFAFGGMTDERLQSLSLVAALDDSAHARDLGMEMQPLNEPRYFVCTNGQRDQCCARLGLPVYRRLRSLVGERAWRTTHVGGHRFAANVLTLADGAVYGRVREADCAALVSQVDAGAIAFDWLRGRSAYPQHVQAAEAFIAQQGLKLLHVDGTDAQAQVEFAGDASRVRLSVRRREKAEMILAGCNKPAAKAVYPFEPC